MTASTRSFTFPGSAGAATGAVSFQSDVAARIAAAPATGGDFSSTTAFPSAGVTVSFVTSPLDTSSTFCAPFFSTVSPGCDPLPLEKSR